MMKEIVKNIKKIEYTLSKTDEDIAKGIIKRSRNVNRRHDLGSYSVSSKCSFTELNTVFNSIRQKMSDIQQGRLSDRPLNISDEDIIVDIQRGWSTTHFVFFYTVEETKEQKKERLEKRIKNAIDKHNKQIKPKLIKEYEEERNKLKEELTAGVEELGDEIYEVFKKIKEPKDLNRI